MSSLILMAAQVVTPTATHSPGWVAVEGGWLTGVGAGAPSVGSNVESGVTSLTSDGGSRSRPGPSIVDLGDAVLAPGYVDMHAHGGGTAAYTEGADAARTVLATHLAHGTTSQVASLVTDTIDALEAQVRALAPLVRSGELLGIHLEGPWLSERHCGAHDPGLLRDPERAEVDRLLDAGQGAVVMATVAVERPGAADAVAHLTERGVIAAPGHSHATYEQAQAAIDAGARVATHLFNAERPIHQREPGLVLALLERDEVVVELIADGVHVHPAMIREAAQRKPGAFALITDAMAAAGAADGDYDLGPLRVQVRDGIARLDGGGAIAGSTLTLDRAVEYAVHTVGLPLADAVRAATLTPANVLGRSDIGRLAPECQADLVVLDPATLHVRRVMHRGVWVEGVPLSS